MFYIFNKSFIAIAVLMITAVVANVVAQRAFDNEEGSKCTLNGVNGTCVNILKCESHIDTKVRENAKICSFQGNEPVVCCTDCEIKEKAYRIQEPHGHILAKTGQKSWDKCLDYIEHLPYSCRAHFSAKLAQRWNKNKGCFDVAPEAVGAAGGTDADRNQYPHMALLGYGSDLDSAQWLCGGSVISDQFILTAGHCTASAALGSVTYVAMGILKRTDPPEYWKRYRVKDIIIHPEYKPPSKYHDIALLKTEKRINFEPSVLPSCLPIQPDSQSYAFATGWGALGRRQQLADTLQAVVVNKFSDADCSSMYPRHRLLKRGFDPATQMCYGNRDTLRDTCEGDSGGPLQASGEASPCVFTIQGVTSTGRECGETNNAGVYTRVLYYVPWIESIVWP